MKITKSYLRKLIKEEINESDFTGGPIHIDPLSAQEQEATRVAYYDLFNYLSTSDLPGDEPSDKLRHALAWIAKFNERHVDAMGKPFTGPGSGADQVGPLHPNYKRKNK